MCVLEVSSLNGLKFRMYKGVERVEVRKRVEDVHILQSLLYMKMYYTKESHPAAGVLYYQKHIVISIIFYVWLEMNRFQ